jgi:hypothetical protein
VKINQVKYPTGQFHNQRMDDIKAGRFPLRLDYLKPRNYNNENKPKEENSGVHNNQ